MLKLSEYRLIRLSSEIEERLSIPATSASTAKPELLITPQEIFPTCLETQSQKTPSIIGGSEMLNPKDLRMSIRREKKQVHFDPSAQPQSKPSAMFEITAKWIRSGEIVSVRESLKNRSLNPEEKDENGQTLLMLAAQNGQASLCEDLLRHGWDPQAEDQDGWTALHNAAKEGFLDVAVLLVTHNASVDCRDGTGWTPLMWACYHGDTQIARFLIDNGAFVNVHDAYHMSALIWASGRGHLEIVEMLLQHGAKVNAGDKFGSTALIWAARKGSGPIVEKLLEHGANVDTAGMFSWTSLIVATKGNYVDIAGQLLEHRPNVNAVDADGYTALAICCKEGYTEIATRLLAAGAYVNMVDKGGDTNLIHAAKVGNLSVVDVLLKRHADIDIQGSDKKTALYWAVEKGHVEVVKSLLAHNPNLELATKDGDTPLMRATRNRNLELVTLLIERKNPAKGSACDKRGDTALHIAMRARSKAICEVLLRNPKNGHLLYRPNKSGETPYNIDAAQQKSILQQIFGARKLNTHEENENMLGYHLASWVNITEQWPCQASWLIHYCETHEQEVDDNVTLRALFDKIRVGMPMTKEIEELQNMDHDIKKMELCLSLNSQALQVGNLRMFVPFAINLDPYIRRVLQDVYFSRVEQDSSGKMGIIAGCPFSGQGFQRKVSTAHSLRNGPWGMSPLAADPRYLQGVVQQSAIQQQQQQTLQQPMYCTPQPYNPMMSPFMYYPPNSSNALPLPLLRQSGRPLSFPERLSAQTKDGICKMLSCLDGLSSANLSAYQESINKHNINGRVLLSCDLQELKVVLNMNFGDWEIFRMHILQLRAAEISALVESPLDESNGLGQQQQLHEWNDKTERQDRDSLGSHSRPSTAVKNDERGSERESSAKCHRKPPTAVKNTTSLEKQVTMEDSMILGALETLNEEAPEDGCHIRELGSVATSLSPILSDEESVPSPSESASSDPCPTPLCPQQVPASARLHVPSGDDGSNAELDFVYIHKTGNSRYSLNSLSTSVPDIEWGTGGGGNTGSAFSTSGGGASSGLAPTPAQGIAAPAAHGLSIPTQNATLVSAPPSIASSPSSGQPLVPARGSSPGLGQDPRALRNKLLDSVTGSPKTPRRNRDSAIKPPSSLTIVEGIPTEDEKKPLLSEMEPVDLPPRGVQPQSAESRRQHFGRQFSIKEDDVDRSSGRPQNASVTRSKSLASDARQEYEELSFSQKRLQREGGSFESAVVAITAGDAGSSASHFSGHSAQSARRSCAILRLHQQSGLTDDPRFKENERNLQEERKTKSTSASTETVI
ncbi:kinase D-interacting substrate of 220 kDa-like isoform X9 [Varroa destructor]|uniref:Kinase D-interacting substrate of 220 kDa-like SAM domain-containing protein n=1 Tax=Varroa destructor TaxID=109461 RepID=A0A7M7JEJ5_VARDE|nr:kinase D-interacting substrate of 220 kDa-like isoform X9 [Varroa destructor]